jgi:hypothetical protein
VHTLRLLPLALLLTGCTCNPGPRAERGERPAKALKSKARGLSREPVAEAPSEPATIPPAEGGPRTIVLVIEDTVRADHMSLCGYERPTTPYIKTLVDKGAVYTCTAYSPGTWTLPSHASYFTGLHTTEHHVLNKGHPLAAEHETLAEHFTARGFQTALVAANPTLNRASGIWQGFAEVRVAKGLYSAWRGPDLAKQLRDVLAGLDPKQPLFLVVNLFEAHDPYPAIPKGVPWLPKRPSLDVNPAKGGDDGPVHRFVRGEMAPQERSDFLAHVIDTYDWGIHEADASLERVIGALGTGGWLDEGFRVVVTSDHGEHLGEHDLVRHDGAPWEGVVRVPVLFYDDTLQAQPTLPEPLSATRVFELLRDGALPADPGEVASAAMSYEQGTGLTRKDSVALWPAVDHKLLWIEGEEMILDPRADPAEVSPRSLGADPAAPRLAEHVQALSRSKELAIGQGVNPEMMQMLEAVGYVD